MWTLTDKLLSQINDTIIFPNLKDLQTESTGFKKII